MRQFEEDENYVLSGDAMASLQFIYMLLITDDGTPRDAIKGDKRRDIAQRMGAILERAHML